LLGGLFHARFWQARVRDQLGKLCLIVG